MGDLLEALMLISFGLAWPFNIVKAYRARTVGSTSLSFYACIWIGYGCGITSKIIRHFLEGYEYNYVFIVYLLDLIMVTIGILIYFRNRVLDRQRSAE